MPTQQLEYRSPGPVITEFLESPAFVTGILGPIGSGKSTASIMKGMMAAQRQPRDKRGRRRSRGAVIRNTYPELKTTTLKSWFEWLPKDMGKWQEEGPPMHTIYGPEGMEAEVMFLALDNPDDVRKLLSLELTWSWINEARETPKSILDGLTGRVGRFPPVRDGGCVGAQIFMDTNAPDTDHWYYTLAEESRPKDFLFLRQPGGRSLGAENLENLPANYYERAAAGKDADWIAVYIDAEYGFVKDGKPVFPEYLDRHHCRSFELDSREPIFVGIDFGLTPAAVIGQRNRLGLWRIRHEIVTEDMGADKFGEALQSFLARRYQGWMIEEIACDPAGDERVGTDKNTPRRVLKEHGIEAKPARTNDPTLRRDAVAKWMKREASGEPGFLVHPDCKVLRKALSGGYCLRRVAVVGKEMFRDKPEKNAFSHVAEALEYMMIGAGESILTVKGRDKKPLGPNPKLPMFEGEGSWMV